MKLVDFELLLLEFFRQALVSLRGELVHADKARANFVSEICKNRSDLLALLSAGVERQQLYGFLEADICEEKLGLDGLARIFFSLAVPGRLGNQVSVHALDNRLEVVLELLGELRVLQPHLLFRDEGPFLLKQVLRWDALDDVHAAHTDPLKQSCHVQHHL